MISGGAGAPPNVVDGIGIEISSHGAQYCCSSTPGSKKMLGSVLCHHREHVMVHFASFAHKIQIKCWKEVVQGEGNLLRLHSEVHWDRQLVNQRQVHGSKRVGMKNIASCENYVMEIWNDLLIS